MESAKCPTRKTIEFFRDGEKQRGFSRKRKEQRERCRLAADAGCGLSARGQKGLARGDEKSVGGRGWQGGAVGRVLTLLGAPCPGARNGRQGRTGSEPPPCIPRTRAGLREQPLRPGLCGEHRPFGQSRCPVRPRRPSPCQGRLAPGTRGAVTFQDREPLPGLTLQRSCEPFWREAAGRRAPPRSLHCSDRVSSPGQTLF